MNEVKVKKESVAVRGIDHGKTKTLKVVNEGRTDDKNIILVERRLVSDTLEESEARKDQLVIYREENKQHNIVLEELTRELGKSCRETEVGKGRRMGLGSGLKLFFHDIS